MTEADWLAATDPAPMLTFLADRASERKLRLFGCACCRRVWRLLPAAGRKAVQASEQHADGRASARRRSDARLDVACAFLAAQAQDRALDARALAAAAAIVGALSPEGTEMPPLAAASATAEWAAVSAGLSAAVTGPGEYSEQRYSDARRREMEEQSRLAREVFGPRPWVRATLNPGWITAPVARFAAAMYNSRVYRRLAILADALEDAGCDNPELLAHLRSTAPHVRGCWALDLVLQKG
jgi:hypothetical protein